MSTPHEFRTPPGTLRARARAPQARPSFQPLLLRALVVLALLAPPLAAALLPASSAAAPLPAAAGTFRPAFAVQLGLDEAVETFAADCVTPKSTFALGETVCAKVTNAPFFGFPIRRLDWVDPAGHVVRSTPVGQAGAQTDLFTLPTSQTSEVSPGVVVDHRGSWAVNSTGIYSAGLRASAAFDVRDPARAAADLRVFNFPAGGNARVNAGSNITINVFALNAGPNDAEQVRLTVDVPHNATFASASQTSGPAFACTHPSAGGGGQSVCTVASLSPRETAGFSFVYTVNPAAANNLVLSQPAEVTSATADPREVNNSSTATASVISTTEAAPCAITCPAGVTLNNAPGQPGATAAFGAPTTTGTCGAVSTTSDSGSFFSIGSSTVTATTEFGQSCSFTVTVNDVEDPVLTVPGDISDAEDAPGSGSAVVEYEVTATDNSGGEVAVSCTNPSGSNFPVGTTPVTCTATDSSGRTASRAFNVTVTGVDDTCTLRPPSVVVFDSDAGSCGALVSYEVQTTGSCGTITYSRAPGSFFRVGRTSVSAASSAGPRTKFVITVVDKNAPVVPALPAVERACVVELSPPTVTDECGQKLLGSTDDPRVYTEPGTYTVNWTFTDAAGNQTTAPQTAVVTADTSGPVPDRPALPTVTGECSVTLAEAPTAADNCTGDIVGTTNDPLTYNVPGTHTVRWTFTDAAGNTSTQNQQVVVTDSAPPTISAPPGVQVFTGPNAPACDVLVTDAQLGSPAAADNCTFTVTRNGVPANNRFPLGNTVITYTATDGAGQTATATQIVSVVDNTPPVVSCPADIVTTLPLNTPDVSVPVTYAVNASDNCGPVTVTPSQPSGAPFGVGTTTVNVSVADGSGNTAACSFDVTVLYNFAGFFSPVSNLPVLNTVNAGRAIPVKFSLSGNKGLDIFAPGFPASGPVACNANDPAAEVTETFTAGGSSLAYAPDQYHYVWKTESAWAGTCRQLVVRLNDGSLHRANFKFK